MEPLNPLFGKITILGIILAVGAIRAPFGRQSSKIPIVANRRGARETFVLALAWFGSAVLPALWVISPLLALADYPLNPAVFVLGIVVAAAGLWLFRRSHVELGRNWSISLDLREGHQLVTSGLYYYVRHPMYAAIFLYSLAQALVLPNWIAGPASLVSFCVLLVSRVGREEEMMVEMFGDQYRGYMTRTKRIIPYLW